MPITATTKATNCASALLVHLTNKVFAASSAAMAVACWIGPEHWISVQWLDAGGPTTSHIALPLLNETVLRPVDFHRVTASKASVADWRAVKECLTVRFDVTAKKIRPGIKPGFSIYQTLYIPVFNKMAHRCDRNSPVMRKFS